MREFATGHFTQEEKDHISREIERFNQGPRYVPFIPFRIQETVDSVRKHGGGQGHNNLLHFLMFEPGHE